MAIEAQLALPYQAGDSAHSRPTQHFLVRHTVLPAVAEYTTERGCRERVLSPSQIGGQGPWFDEWEKDRHDQRHGPSKEECLDTREMKNLPNWHPTMPGYPSIQVCSIVL